jgi:Skp family chaperone for outer membrane proteins
MNRTLTLITALGAGLATANVAVAQAAPAAAPAAAAPSGGPAVVSKVALINFEQVVLASNEGQVVTANTQKKFEPRKSQIEALGAEVDTLKKNLPANLPDQERATRLQQIDTKEKQLNLDVESATTAYNTELQEALSKVAAKLAGTMRDYAQANGYTLLLDVSNQSSNVLWTLPSAHSDISQAVVDAYNKSSGIAAPPPPAPSARPAGAPARPAAAKPAGPAK